MRKYKCLNALIISTYLEKYLRLKLINKYLYRQIPILSTPYLISGKFD